MKKYLKYILISVILIISALSLCSCKELDQMRDVHAIYDSSGNIIFHNAVYKQLQYTGDYYPNIVSDKRGAVTEPDVPVLLSTAIGQSTVISEDEAFLIVSGYNSPSADYSYAYSEYLYVREDKYDEIAEKMKNPNFSSYLICYDRYNPKTYIWESKCHILTESEKNAIENILSGEGTESDLSMGFQYYSQINISRGTSDGFLINSRGGVTLYFDESDFYLEIYSEGDGTETYGDGKFIIYKVPSEYKSIFEGLKKYSFYGYDDFFYGDDGEYDEFSEDILNYILS